FDKAKKLAKSCSIVLVILMLLIGAITPIYTKLPLDSFYKMIVLGALFILTIISFLVLIKVVDSKNHVLPYWSAVTIFVFTYASMLV
ncbi:cytochrome d ubiquinol oxidase subunit II, partial [Francisella noatunensis subsp. orientalis]|nr:cytochrome d ubiquinol oxidase subunit II [Francisella orientalis]NIY52963.1 cytochrome d ubiquinol oxidase subunit II [Francisella orientalis]NIY58937.1 cytochrome d ubiquinol oxidase subunit II [Francisella orientalis]